MTRCSIATVGKAVLPALTALVFVSCASTSKDFTAYKQDTVFVGHGGVVRTVDGIEFWTEGSPDRKFKIIGVISARKPRPLRLPGMLSEVSQLGGLAEKSPESHLASEAKAHGADAVILIQRNSRQGAFEDSEGEPGAGYKSSSMEDPADAGRNSRPHGSAEAYIIKYVADGN